MSASEAKALTRDFQSAQREETKALDKKQRSDLKELEASQKQRLKEWDEKEREARRAFLKQTTKGELIRPYMKDFRTRRSALISGMSEEKQRLLTEQLAAREALKGDQELRQKQFQEFLLKQEHPPKSLWPQAPNH